MSAIYYLTFVLWVPLQMVAYALYGLSCGLEFIAGFIHDQTTYRAWSVLHARECDKIFKKEPTP